ncbi:MAG: RNA-binding protein [Thermosphaera sp.]
MKKLGRVHQVTRDGNVILVSEVADASKTLGFSVYDENMRRVGRVVDIIGRVEDPRIVVKLENPEVVASIHPGSFYYFQPPVERKPRRAGRRTRR